MSYRLATINDEGQAIHAALRRLKRFAETYEFVSTIDFPTACTSVADAVSTGRGLLVDGYLVLIDVFTPWYTKDKVLQEWLVLKLYDGGTVDSIPPALRHYASDNRCSVILTADSSPINIMAAAYEKAGFTKLTTSFCTKV